MGSEVDIVFEWVAMGGQSVLCIIQETGDEKGDLKRGELLGKGPHRERLSYDLIYSDILFSSTPCLITS